MIKFYNLDKRLYDDFIKNLGHSLWYDVSTNIGNNLAISLRDSFWVHRDQSIMDDISDNLRNVRNIHDSEVTNNA